MAATVATEMMFILEMIYINVVDVKYKYDLLNVSEDSVL